LDDLEVICLFIARDAPAVAAMFAQRALDSADRLAEFHGWVERCRNWGIRISVKSFLEAIA
jgi:hypothetical protein